MKKIVLQILFFAMVVSFSEIAKAGEVDDLRKEIRQLRAEYEAKIQKLQAQVDTLVKNEKEKDKGPEEKSDKKFLDIEYVGRYKGPFKKGGLIARESSGFGNVSVGGYMDHEFESFEKSTATFDQHRWIINIGAELANRLRFYSEYEIEHGGPDASGGGEAKVEQAWLDFLIMDWINLRAGALLVPFGRYNLYHDSDLQDLTARPIVARDIIPTTWTEAGAGAWGEFNPAIGSYEDLTLGYEIYAINGLDGGFSDTGMGGARGSLESDNNKNKAVVGRFVVSPLIGHEFGVSGYFGEYDTSGNYIKGIGLDWFDSFDVPLDIPGLSFGPLELVGDFAYFTIDEPVTRPIASDVPRYMAGYYAQANLHFWPEFLNNTFLGRNFDNPTFTLVGRYGWAEIQDDIDAANEGPNIEDRFTIGLNYRPIESWVFKLEYQINRGKNESLENGDRDGFMASVAMGF